MLLVIHNLPSNSKYADLKAMIQSKCGLTEVILDNLVNEGPNKRVTVGLADDGDAALLVRKINGLYVGGQQLYVEDIRQKKESEQPYRSSKKLSVPQEPYDPFSLDYSSNSQDDKTMNIGYQNQDPMNMMMNYNMAAMGAMYYMPGMTAMPQTQNSYLGFGGQQQQIPPLMAQAPQIQARIDRPFGAVIPKEDTPDLAHGMQRPTYTERRALSPARGNRSDKVFDRRSSRWDEDSSHAGNINLRRSRSPPRGQWNSRDRDNRQDRFADYYDDPTPMQNSESQRYSNAPQNLNYPDNYGSSQTLCETPSSNNFGSHVSQPGSSRWDQSNNQNLHKSDSFQSHRGRRDVPRPRGDRNPRENFKSEQWSSNRNDSGPSRQRNERRDVARVPPKRENMWGSNGPEAKKFAPPRKDPTPKMSTQPKFNEKGSLKSLNPRDRKPEGINPPESLQKLLNRDETWRAQAASTLAKETLKNLQIEIPANDKIFTHLKQSIRARINVMLGDKMLNREVIMETYASKFPSSGNQEFFMTVVNNLKKLEALSVEPGAGGSDAVTKPVPQGSPVAKASKAPVAKPDEKAPSKPKPAQPASGRLLPKYPVGDKQMNKKLKAMEKKEWHTEEYDLPEFEKKVLFEELDTLCDVFMSECMSPDDKQDQPVCEQIADIVSDEFRKVVRVHTSRRLLNITKRLFIRVHTGGPKPSKPAIEKYLMKHGCVSLFKSDRNGHMFVAHMDSFKNYDKILALQSAKVGDITLTFKPLQVCGPPPSASVIRQQHHERIKKFVEMHFNKTNENILQPGYVYNPKAEKDGSTDNKDQKETSSIEANELVKGEDQKCENEDQKCEDGDLKCEDNGADQDAASENDEDAAPEDYPENDITGEMEDIPDDIDEDDLEDY